MYFLEASQIFDGRFLIILGLCRAADAEGRFLKPRAGAPTPSRQTG
jgi:hypothetical protein